MSSRRLDTLLALSLAVPLLACGLLHEYKAGGFVASGEVDPRAVRSSACVDYALDLGGRGDLTPLLMTTRFGNRCSEPALVDLNKLVITARYPDGRSQELHLVDPRNEIEPLHLEPHVAAVEKIQLGPGVDGAPSRICVDVRAASEGGQGAPPICWVPQADGWSVAP